jgi:hypothetical protein
MRKAHRIAIARHFYKSGANWAALESLNAERSTPIKDR